MARLGNHSVDHVVQDALECLKGRGYSPGTISNYRRSWMKLQEYAYRRKRRRFTLRLTYDYWEAEGRTVKSFHSRRFRKRSLELLRNFVAAESYSKSTKLKCNSLPGFMGKALVVFNNYGKNELGWAETTASNQIRWAKHFLSFLHELGVKTWRSLKMSDINNYFASRIHENACTNISVLCIVKQFLRILYIKGLLRRPFYSGLPVPRRSQYRQIHPFWSPEELAKTLEAIDKDLPAGKRNYAIILLAARLGLRGGDIKRLRLDDIHWDRACIRLTQGKTGEHLTLPLLDDIADALVSYIRDARPRSKRREIFLSAYAPFAPLSPNNNLRDDIARYRDKAELPSMPHRGLHSLRHTLATCLLKNNQPITLIGNLLGHMNIDTTQQYLRLDFDGLRKVGLDPEKEINHAK